MKPYRTYEIFPTLFYEFQRSEAEIRPLLEEVQEKKKEIKKRYNSEKDDYWTDYNNPIKLLEYEKIIKEISIEFFPQLQCDHLTYWTAIYGERGYHAAHQHANTIFQLETPNMSSVLYLSNIGTTHFYNPNQLGINHQDYYIQSEVGKMYMWPSHLLHEALPHGKKDKERFIISSNWRIQHARYGSGGTGAGSGNIN